MKRHPDYVAIANHTIMDGLVIRWYKGIYAAEISRESVSASRHSVIVKGDNVPDEVIEFAMQARRTIAAGLADDAKAEWVTHHAVTPLLGPPRRVTPIEPTPAPVDLGDDPDGDIDGYDGAITPVAASGGAS